LPTYTFSCVCGWQGEQRTSFTTNGVCCPSCAATATKESVYRISFKGFTPTPRDERTYHQEFKDFREAGAELEYNHSRMEEAAGATLSKPPLGRIAKADAKALMKAGVTSSEDWKSRKKH
jgi:hypothetical protein